VFVHSCCVNIFKTLRLRDHWAEVDDTRHVYSRSLGTKHLGSRILNFSPCAAWATQNLAQLGEMTHTEWGGYCT